LPSKATTRTLLGIGVVLACATILANCAGWNSPSSVDEACASGKTFAKTVLPAEACRQAGDFHKETDPKRALQFYGKGCLQDLDDRNCSIYLEVFQGFAKANDPGAAVTSQAKTVAARCYDRTGGNAKTLEQNKNTCKSAVQIFGQSLIERYCSEHNGKGIGSFNCQSGSATLRALADDVLARTAASGFCRLSSSSDCLPYAKIFMPQDADRVEASAHQEQQQKQQKEDEQQSQQAAALRHAWETCDRNGRTQCGNAAEDCHKRCSLGKANDGATCATGCRDAYEQCMAPTKCPH
jgi:hypothetical protein